MKESDDNIENDQKRNLTESISNEKDAHANLDFAPYFQTLRQDFKKVSFRVFIFGLSAGSLLIILGQILQSDFSLGHFREFLSEFLVHLGTGAIVSALAVILFDSFFHKNMIGDPLKGIKQEITDADSEIKKININIKEANTDINKITSNVGSLVFQIEELSSIIGYSQLRKQILNSYEAATHRIISVSDYWPIDTSWWDARIQNEPPDWWKSPEAWTTCELYLSLNRQPFPREGITFVGTMPWPAYDNRDSLELTPFDFDRLLGLVWRLNVVHCLRQSKFTGHERRNEKIRIVIADIPVKATIVDNTVFVILPREENLESWRGTQLTGMRSAIRPLDDTQNREREVADAYADLVLNYICHARSAREYINSILCLAELHNLHIDKNQKVRPFLQECLTTLGLSKWLDSKPESERKAKTETALGIFFAFLEYYPAATLDMDVDQLAFLDLRMELL